MTKKILIIILAIILLLPNVSFAGAKQFTIDTGSTLTTNLVAYYKLEDVNDYYASYNLTNNNSVTFSAGKINNAADTGSSNTTKYLNIANNMGINGGNASISCWVNITTAPSADTYNGIVSQLNNTSDVGYAIAYRDNGGTKKVFFIREKSGVANQGVDVTQTLTIGTWYHLVLTYDGTNVEGWINGVSQGTAAASGNGTVASDHFAIGGFAYGGGANQTMSGLVDEVGVWSKALSDQEVADLYNSGNGQTMCEVGVDCAVTTIAPLMKIFWFF